MEDGKEQLILNPESHFQSARLSPKSVQPLLSDSDNELVCFTFTQQSSYADFKLLCYFTNRKKKLLSLLTN